MSGTTLPNITYSAYDFPLYAPFGGGGGGAVSTFTTLNTSSLVASTITLDNQVLTAAPTELLLNGIPLATTSNLSSIADWAVDPAISTVNLAGNDIINGNYVEAGQFVGLLGNFQELFTSSLLCSTIVANEIVALSTIQTYNYLSATNLVVDDGIFKTISSGCVAFEDINAPGNYPFRLRANSGTVLVEDQFGDAGQLTASTIFTSTLTADQLNVPTVNLSSITVGDLNATNLNASTMNVSSFNANVLDTNVVSSLIGDIALTLVSSIQLSGTFSPNLNLSLGFGSASTWLAGLIGGSAGAFGALNSGIVGPTLGRQNNYFQPNAWEQVAATTQLQFSTIPTYVSSILRFNDGNPANITPGNEVYVSTVYAPGDFIRSVGDPVNTLSSPTQVIQAFGEWVRLPDIGVSSFVSTFNDLTVNELTVNSNAQIASLSTALISSGTLEASQIFLPTAGPLYLGPGGVNITEVSPNRLVITTVQGSIDIDPLTGITFIEPTSGNTMTQNSNGLTADPIQTNNLNATNQVSTARVQASSIQLAPSTTLIGYEQGGLLEVLETANLGNYGQVACQAVGLGATRTGAQVALFYQNATPNRVGVIDANGNISSIAYLSDIPGPVAGFSTIIAGAVSTNTVSTGLVAFGRLGQILVGNDGDISCDPNGNASLTFNYTGLGSRPSVNVNELNCDQLGSQNTSDINVIANLLMPFGNYISSSQVYSSNVNSRVISSGTVGVSSLTFTGLPNSTITFATTATAGTQGQQAGRLVMSGQDLDLGQNDLFVQQIRLGAGNATNAQSELIFYDAANNVRVLQTALQDRTLRVGSTINTTAGGYLLDTGLNPPFFSTINNNVNMMAFFPSTTNSTIGVSTISVIPNYVFSAYSSTSQTVVAANTATNLTHNVVTTNVGGFTNLGSTITVPVGGVYEIGTSIQFLTSSGGTNPAFFWLKKNGSNVPQTNSKVSIVNNGDTIGTVTFFDTAVANDKYTIAIESSDTNMQAGFIAATGDMPAVPSVITNIKKIG